MREDFSQLIYFVKNDVISNYNNVLYMNVVLYISGLYLLLMRKLKNMLLSNIV
ncbi:hypothetical protein SH1V18_11520 [Vallitalea longa]|uniref:Uncharacterized protein n=1 Tax=Vallitalea longa TaxID=2936439 RepID=A0A9W5Y7W1_9FIRM|nr:hypothetical protein SH1V18_11520 [Vallitalea longa]